MKSRDFALRVARASVLGVACVCASFGNAEELLVIDDVETAGISGFRAQWDKPLPGALVLDAVHRSLLVRFPGAAERIYAELAKGKVIEKVELSLPFDSTEISESVQAGYKLRLSFGSAELFKKIRPQWHAVAWALQRPWVADAERGPTFNAAVNGVAYWSTYGAKGEDDRHPHRFGPTEVSFREATEYKDVPETPPPAKPEADPLLGKGDAASVELDAPPPPQPARMDVTTALTETEYGKTIGERLRRLDECGFLLRKWEQYDFRYRAPGQGAYEWAVATGGRGIRIKAPKLIVTLSAGRSDAGALPPATDVRSAAAAGKPTAIMPDAGQIAALIARFGPQQPDWMPEWQWQRVNELLELGGGYRIPATPEEYAKWVDTMLADPPRYWNGWDVPDRLIAYFLYEEALPAYVRDHYFSTYWTAWLMPDRPTDELEHPQAVEIWHKGRNLYYEKTGDWRGNASFFRDGYCYAMSTMNFNHTAAMGALLAGTMIGSERAVADGRHGLEHWPLRTWCWYDGSTQESIDHYYFSLTLSAQKLFADFGPTHLDRMMGQSILAKSVEELTSAYHPGLRHFLASSTRTGVPNYAIVTQDGLQYIMHTLSRSGALHDLGAEHGPDDMRVIGKESPPGRIAQLALTQPWAPPFVSRMVDEKPIPYEMINTYKQWGHHAAHPLWRRTYLGHHYGLASTDLYPSAIPILGHWRRSPHQVAQVRELGTMLVRYGMNDTAFVNAASGWLAPYGIESAVHVRNRMIVVTKPNDLSKRVEPINSLQASIALYNYERPAPSWAIYAGDRKVAELPFETVAGEWIVVHDGVSYLGFLPLPAMDLGRTAEVRLEPGVEQISYDKSKSLPALVIHNYNFRSDAPASLATPQPGGTGAAADLLGEDGGNAVTELAEHLPLGEKSEWERITRAYGGFVIEWGDATEYVDLAAFRAHLAATKLDTRWEEEASVYHVTYAAAGDTLEVGCKMDYTGGPTPGFFAYRRVNGEWPYLPDGIDRDTTLTQQGRTGRLEKNGAVLLCEEGRMAYLQTEPLSGTFCGWNPLPDAALWSLSAPTTDGHAITVTGDGRLSLTRVIMQPSANRVAIDYAAKADQDSHDMAQAMLLFGCTAPPAVTLNGEPVHEAPRMDIDGKPAYIVPLAGGPIDRIAQAAPARYRATKEMWTRDRTAAP